MNDGLSNVLVATTWPLAVVIIGFVFRKGILNFLSKGGTVKYGSFSFEASPHPLRPSLPISFEPSMTGKMVAEVLSTLPEVAADIRELDLGSLPPETFFRGLVPLFDECTARLEYVCGLPRNTLNRYGMLRSKSLGELVEGGRCDVQGFYEDEDQVLVAVIIWDFPGFTGADLSVSVGAYLGLCAQAIGDTKDWRLLVGVLSGRPDSAQRLVQCHEFFGPAARSKKLTLVELTFSVGMTEALARGLTAVAKEWDESKERV